MNKRYELVYYDVDVDMDDWTVIDHETEEYINNNYKRDKTGYIYMNGVEKLCEILNKQEQEIKKLKEI